MIFVKGPDQLNKVHARAGFHFSGAQNFKFSKEIFCVAIHTQTPHFRLSLPSFFGGRMEENLTADGDSSFVSTFRGEDLSPLTTEVVACSNESQANTRFLRDGSSHSPASGTG